jgi:GNAT superfamily N-acetyltransferase
MSHSAFCIRALNAEGTSRVAGVFYIKPNFPGRCSHICNGGFITDPDFRGQGIGSLMAQAFQFLAQELGYKASYFNLVSIN